MQQELAKLAAAATKRSLPDHILRAGCRHVIRQRLRDEDGFLPPERAALLRRWHSDAQALSAGIGDEPGEIPAEFFAIVLGQRLKYSSCLWDDDGTEIDVAQEAMLATAAERAGIENGMRVLDLGCGWGAMSLYLAQAFPDAEIVAVSDSAAHGEHIRKRAAARDLANVSHVIAELSRLDIAGGFDAVVTTEATDRILGQPQVLADLDRLTDRGASVFVQTISHTDYWWEFEDGGPGEWTERQSQPDAALPSHNLFHRLIEPHMLEESWWIEGSHHRRTLEAWLARLTADRNSVQSLLRPIFGDDTRLMIHRWRILIMASSELVGFPGSELLGVSQHRLRLSG